MKISTKLGISCTSLLLAAALVGCTPAENGLEDDIEQEELNQETDQGEEQNPQSEDTDSEVMDEQDQDLEHDQGKNQNEPGSSLTDRPAEKVDTIMIEGMEDSFSFRKYDDNALRISTYIIEGMAVDAINDAEGDKLFVYYDRDGERDPKAIIQFFKPAEDIDLLAWVNAQGFQFKESIESNMEIEGLQGSRLDLLELKKDNEFYNGYVAEIEKGERRTYLFVYSAYEYSDGFEPRVNKLLEDLEWLE